LVAVVMLAVLIGLGIAAQRGALVGEQQREACDGALARGIPAVLRDVRDATPSQPIERHSLGALASAVRCGWFEGRPFGRVSQLLGPGTDDGRPAVNGQRDSLRGYGIPIEPGALLGLIRVGAREADLELRVDTRSQRVVGATFRCRRDGSLPPSVCKGIVSVDGPGPPAT
jgi:hypothetical protein